MVLITIVTGAYKPTNITGGPHIVPIGNHRMMIFSNVEDGKWEYNGDVMGKVTYPQDFQEKYGGNHLMMMMIMVIMMIMMIMMIMIMMLILMKTVFFG